MKGHCYYCEIEFGYKEIGLDPEPVKKTKDHIIPSSRGGINDPKNIVPACFQCNKAKANLMPEEFLELLRLGKPIHLGKKRIAIMIPNIERLIATIAPYRNELWCKGIMDARAIKEVVADRLAFSPSNLQQERSQKKFLIDLKKKYPFINDLLIEANPDLPRWIFDNLIKK